MPIKHKSFLHVELYKSEHKTLKSFTPYLIEIIHAYVYITGNVNNKRVLKLYFKNNLITINKELIYYYNTDHSSILELPFKKLYKN